MAHQRLREIETLLSKRIKLWPVLGIVGVRQCGKSTLLRDLFLAKHSGTYQTMDSATQRERAQQAPESFTTLENKNDLLVIDEIQKVPDLFDAIKLHVDQRRRPGMYMISGSTEFSQLTGIRESLTGRVGILHLYPMTLGELHSKVFGNYFLKKSSVASHLVSLKEFDRKLQRGGMPGLCFLRDDSEFIAACQVWLETTCFRDLLQIQGKVLNGNVALEILMAIATLPEATMVAIAKKLKRDVRLIKPYLEALLAILVIHRLEPHEAGVGKAQYMLCDSGLAAYLGSDRETQLRTHILIEALAKFEYAGLGRPLIKTYRNEKTSRVPIILEWPNQNSAKNVAIALCDSESVPSYEYERLWAFAKRATGKNYRLLLLTQSREAYVEKSKSHSLPVEVFSLRG